MVSMLSVLASACSGAGSGTESESGTEATQSNEPPSTAGSEEPDAEPMPDIGGPAPAAVVTRIAGEWPTPGDFVFCSAQVNVTGAAEGSWESEAIAGSDVMGFTTLYAALSEDGSQRAEAQAAEGYDESGAMLYSIAIVDYAQGATYSGQVDETIFSSGAADLKGLSIRDLEMPSNEGDGTAVAADITFEC